MRGRMVGVGAAVIGAWLVGGNFARAVDLGSPALARKLAELNERYGLGERVRFVAGEGGLVCAEVRTSACSGRVYLQGAHVAAWQPTGEEPVLMMSGKSAYAAGVAMRGGVPVVFPWFGGKADDPRAPGHGVVRTKEWAVESVRGGDSDSVVMTFVVKSDAETKRWWPGDFEVREVVTMGKELGIELRVKNVGTAPMTFEEGLHNYFAVEDVEKVQVKGFEGVKYIDKVDGRKEKMQAGAIVFRGETDRIYEKTKGPYEIVDAGEGGWRRKIVLEKRGSVTGVVWNVGGSKPVADFGEGDWRRYVCVEAANLGADAVTKAGEEVVMGERVRVER
ncbi:MAG TPA: D-hexose-6-phosphate mutarotase [Phycisphaerae bacterium]|nr:D-hexose-6-phosphate mutarotase [Phycisphaerae bacterium]